MHLPALEQMVDAHLAAYCEPDADRRLAAIRAIWNLEGRLVDPPIESSGHAGISDQAAALQAQFPGHRFERSTALDLHHHFVRYGWRLLDPAGRPVLAGVDFMDLDVDGRIGRVVGFFGDPPPAAQA
ncbi:MAG: nuclear transport factor 2 family protein [Burkholderiales bacterium]|nr:nuclear transport factor 2 family protein [Burkholderiales bacterium]